MLLIDNQTVTLKQIQDYDGSDNNHAMQILHDGYLELKKRFFDQGRPVIFAYKKGVMKVGKDGIKEGKRGIYVPWADVLKTPSGTYTVVYCETVINEPNGNKRYEPRGARFFKKKVLRANDAELALFYFKVSSTFTIGKSVELYDEEKEGAELAKSRANDAEIKYLIYSDYSPLAENRDKLVNLAYAWGVPNADKLSDNQLKNRLFTIIESPTQIAEMSRDKFKKQVKDFDPLHETLGLIGRAMGTGVLIFEDYQWRLKAGNVVTKLVNVPPQDHLRYKIILAQQLLADNNSYRKVRSVAFPGENEETKTEPVRQEGVKGDSGKFDLDHK
jgi:hypothetical protein